MREDILTASTRVLKRDGAPRFTTPRVAEAAGISVGSLYQYFPNKQALLFALHSRTVEAVWVEVKRILDHPGQRARAKIRRMARLFFLSESADVAEMGPLLQGAEVLCGDRPERRAMNELVMRRARRFVREALPLKTPRARVKLGAELLVTVLESVGRSVARQRLSPRDVRRWGAACADMVADYLGLD